MKIKKIQILKELERVFDIYDVKYDIRTKTFDFKKDKERREITFDGAIAFMESRELNKDGESLLNIFKMLKRSYFPRRLKVTIEEFYEVNDLKIPKQLYIRDGNLEIEVGNTIHYIEYNDDFNVMLDKMAQIYGVSEEVTKNSKYEPKNEDFIGHYHP